MFAYSSKSAYHLWEDLGTVLVRFQKHGSRRDLNTFKALLRDLQFKVRSELS
jgi:hypothetical protein